MWREAKWRAEQYSRSLPQPTGPKHWAQVATVAAFAAMVVMLVGCIRQGISDRAHTIYLVEIAACWVPVAALACWVSFSAVRYRWDRALVLRAIGALFALISVLGLTATVIYAPVA